MTPTDLNIYRVIVLLGAGYDALFASPAAALIFAQAEMETLLLEYEDLASAPFGGIACERRDTQETWRYESVGGFAVWVWDPDITIQIAQVNPAASRGLNPLEAANLPRFYC